MKYEKILFKYCMSVVCMLFIYVIYICYVSMLKIRYIYVVIYKAIFTGYI